MLLLYLFLASLDIFFGDSPLAKVDVALLFVDMEHHHELDPTHLDETADAPNLMPRELGEQDHALDVVVLEEWDVGAHVGDVLHLNHHCHVNLWVLCLVYSALQVWSLWSHACVYQCLRVFVFLRFFSSSRIRVFEW